MSTRQIIDESRALARRFAEKGPKKVRLPVFDFEDWLAIHGLNRDGAALNQFQTQTRKNWYLIQFLGHEGLEPEPVPVRAEEFLPWAEEGGHDLSDGHQRAHAVGDYVNRPETKAAVCMHAEMAEAGPFLPEPCLATITVFGHNVEEPEVMSVVIHRDDGSVLASKSILATDHSPQEAWDTAREFLDRFQPQGVFHDQQIRRPEFCPDCNGLMVNVASAKDVENMAAASRKE